LAVTALTVTVTSGEIAGTACTTVHLAGEADVTTTGLGEALGAEVARKPRLLLVDMSALTFLDSSALHAILRAHKAQRAAGCTLALVSPSGAAARILALTGIDQVLPVFASAEQAAARLDRARSAGAALH
jgi:anti-sigma B factor antagonist